MVAIAAKSPFNALMKGLPKVLSSREYRGLFMVNVVTALCSAMLGPVLPLWILKEVTSSASVVFFTLAGIGVVVALLNVVVGHVTDLIGRRNRVVELSLLLAALRGVLYTWFPYIPVVIGASAVTGLSTHAMIFAMLEDRIEENGDQEARGLIVATVRSAASIGYIIGPWLGISIVSAVSYRYFFIAYSALYCLAYLVAKFQVRTPSFVAVREKRKTPESAGFLVVACVALAAACVLSGSTASGPLLALYASKVSTGWFVAAVFGVGPVVEIVAFPFVGLVNDKIGPYKTLVLGCLAEAVYFWLLYSSKSPAAILIVQAFGSFYTAVLFTSLLMYIQSLLAGRSGLSSSLFFASMSVSKVAGQALIGAVVGRATFNVGFLLLGGLAVVGLMMVLIVQNGYGRSQKTGAAAVGPTVPG